MEITAAYHYFLVYLPNATSVKVRVDGAILFNLTVKKFVELARVFYEQNTTSNTEACRPIEWGGRVHLDDLKGLSVDDGDFTSLVNEMKEEDRCLLLFVSCILMFILMFIFMLMFIFICFLILGIDIERKLYLGLI